MVTRIKKHLSRLAVSLFMLFTLYAFPGTNDNSLNLLANPDMSVIKNGVPEGWTIRGQARVEYNREEKAATVYTELTHDSVTQTVSLPPGHYLFRALARTNTYAVSLKALGSMPLGISDDYRWTELPFYIDGAGAGNLAAMVGIHIPSVGGGRQGDVFAQTRIKKMELIRLGDTSLPRRWAKTIPANIIHGLETLNNNPEWNRPGKVIFHDTFMGTELWLMTQGGKTDLSYVGKPDFSNEGKYVQVGNRRPGDVMRTDGSRMHRNPIEMGKYGGWTGSLLWLFPWEREYVPEGEDLSDWIVKPNRTASFIDLQNIVTGQTSRIELPSREGWQIISVPSIHRTGRGPNIKDITHDTLVWYSEDKKHLAVSNVRGENFRVFEIRSISRKPENDSGIHIKSPYYLVQIYDTWYNPVDKNGTRYFIFDFNRGKSINDPYNPYQLWALPLNEGDPRGLLRVVIPEPPKNIPEDAPATWVVYSQNKGTQEGCFFLEDGTIVHGSALGMHSGFAGTIRAKSGYYSPVRFIGNYPRMDRVSWPHEFKHDRDFAIVEAFTEPQCPVLMVDLENDTFWTLAVTNFHDYAARYAQRPMYSGRPGFGEYHKPMIRTAPTQSPDFTKVVYCSSMLVGEDPERIYGDAYIAVARYPQPPVNIRLEGDKLAWEKPRYSAEIMGFNVYYSKESGRGTWTKINSLPVKDTRYPLPGGKNGFYVVTSVEHSGLESRRFSNEVSVGRNRVLRHFYQPSEGKLAKPMVPFFEPKGASNLYAVAVTDPELIYKQRLEEGLEGSVKIEAGIPLQSRWRVLARVRGMSGIERASYAAGWKPSGEAGSGAFRVTVNGRDAGRIPVEGFEWKWVEMEDAALNLPAGKAEITFSTSDAGIALDNVLVTNDLSFAPSNLDNTPTAKPSEPAGLKVEEMKAEGETLEWRGYSVKPPYVKLAWKPSTAPQGVRYYNIYRAGEKGFKPSPATLIGSNAETWFVDTGLKQGADYFYRMVAVDNWDNRSQPSQVIYVKIN